MNKKFATVTMAIALAGIFMFSAAETVKVVKTAAAGVASVSMTNSNSILEYDVVDVFVNVASNTTGSSEIVLEETSSGTAVFVDSGTIATNKTGCSIDLANIVLPQKIGDSCKITRPTTATNGLMTVIFVVENKQQPTKSLSIKI